MGGNGASSKSSKMGKQNGKGSRTIKPWFRKNTANEAERIFDEQTKWVREKQRLERGLAQLYAREKIDNSGATTLKIKEYQVKLKEAKKKASDLGEQWGKLVSKK